MWSDANETRRSFIKEPHCVAGHCVDFSYFNVYAYISAIPQGRMSVLVLTGRRQAPLLWTFSLTLSIHRESLYATVSFLIAHLVLFLLARHFARTRISFKDIVWEI